MATTLCHRLRCLKNQITFENNKSHVLIRKQVSPLSSYVLVIPPWSPFASEKICAVGGIASGNRAKRSKCTRGWCCHPFRGQQKHIGDRSSLSSFGIVSSLPRDRKPRKLWSHGDGSSLLLDPCLVDGGQQTVALSMGGGGIERAY